MNKVKLTEEMIEESNTIANSKSPYEIATMIYANAKDVLKQKVLERALRVQAGRFGYQTELDL